FFIFPSFFPSFFFIMSELFNGCVFYTGFITVVFLIQFISLMVQAWEPSVPFKDAIHLTIHTRYNLCGFLVVMIPILIIMLFVCMVSNDIEKADREYKRKREEREQEEKDRRYRWDSTLKE